MYVRATGASAVAGGARGDDPPGVLRGTRGFTLLGLMVVIAVINIGLGVAATSWVIVNKRAKEAELIWRGQQYVRALQCHRQQTGGFPDDLDELIQSDCIRALYPEPMSRDGRWRIIRESDLQAEAFARGDRAAVADPSVAEEVIDRLTLPAPARTAGSASSGESGARQGLSSGAQPVPQDRLRLQAEATSTMSERLRALTDRLRQGAGGSRGSGNGIVGVASSSTAESLRLYQGEDHYDAWRFVAQ